MSSFYDRYGQQIAYTEDGEHIYLFDGKPVGYIYKSSVYAYSGSHLGWIDKGWVFDHAGNNVFFTENASGGPTKPVKWVKPVKSVKRVKPVKGVKQLKPIKSPRSMLWSELSGIHFFG